MEEKKASKRSPLPRFSRSRRKGGKKEKKKKHEENFAE